MSFGSYPDTFSPSAGGHGVYRTDGNQWIDTNASADALSANGEVDYTMMAWINPSNDRGGDQMVFGQREGNALHNGIRDRRLHQGHWGNDLNAGAATVNFNTWQHIAFTYRGGEQAVYINGQQIVAEAHGPLNNPANVVIGQARDNTGRAYEGLLDDVRIYGSALSADQIASVAGIVDSDGDGLLDPFERSNFGTLAFGSGDDNDGDGLDNGGEQAAGTSPIVPDTDGDGAHGR